MEPEFSIDFGKDDLGAWTLTQYANDTIMIKRHGGPTAEIWIKGRVTQGTRTGSVSIPDPFPQSINRRGMIE